MHIHMCISTCSLHFGHEQEVSMITYMYKQLYTHYTYMLLLPFYIF